jgi:hypothetical protein
VKNDIEFLTECGIAPELPWLAKQQATTPEQQRYVNDLLRINEMLGARQPQENL